MGVIRPPKKAKEAGLQGKRYSHISRAPTPTFELLPLHSHPLLKGWEWSRSNPEVLAGGAHTRERVQGDGDLLDEAKARKKIAEAEETYAAPRIANAQRARCTRTRDARRRK